MYQIAEAGGYQKAYKSLGGVKDNYIHLKLFNLTTLI